MFLLLSTPAPASSQACQWKIAHPRALEKRCVEAIRAGLNCGVTGPFLGDWNRLMCVIRVRPDCIDAQFTRLTAPPDNVAVGAVFEQL